MLVIRTVGSNHHAMGTDAEWEKWGKNHPYFGVLARDSYRSHNLTAEAKREFFESGRTQIRHVLEVCRHHFGSGLVLERVLDFGCGTGRLVIPLAELADEVVGLDVSNAMLQEARKNCDEHDVQNVLLLKSDDDLSALKDSFDLIHSSIVFQHIPVKRGKRIFANLLNHLNDGGIGVLQFTYAKAKYAATHGAPRVGKPMREWPANVVRSVSRLLNPNTPVGDAEMQMNSYDLNALCFLIQSAGVNAMHVEFTDHGGELGVVLYFQKATKLAGGPQPR